MIAFFFDTIFLIVATAFLTYAALVALHAIIWKILIYWDKQDSRREI